MPTAAAAAAAGAARPPRRPSLLLAVMIRACAFLIAVTVQSVTAGCHQRAFQVDANQRLLVQSPPHTSLSYDGLHVNAPLHPRPMWLTVTTIPSQELDPQSAKLYFSPVQTRSWDDVMLRCGDAGGIASCENDDLLSSLVGDATPCTPVKSTPDGRALFDPLSRGCEPLAKLWNQRWLPSNGDDVVKTEQLLSFKAHLQVDHIPTSLDNSTHTADFWLAHLQKSRALWPLSNEPWTAVRAAWDGKEPNRIAGLMEDPHFQRATKPERNDRLNGVDLTAARWNLGVSLRIPPMPGGDSANATLRAFASSPSPSPSFVAASTLLPVHAPVGGQVVWIDTYRRPNAPSPLNDEQGWVIAIRDEWGFVWSLWGISPYHQHVWVGQNIPQGHVIGHVSRRPLSKVPRDQNAPADPPEKPPGGDGNPSYPYRFRELRLSVAFPGKNWTQWRDPKDEGWQWFNPLLLLTTAARTSGSPATAAASAPPPPSAPPPLLSPPFIFFARPTKPKQGNLPVAIPDVIASVSPKTDDGDGDDDDIVTLDGSIEIIAGVRTFVSSSVGSDGERDGGKAFALTPAGLYKLEWAVVPRNNSEKATASCDSLGQDVGWRVAFEHDRLPRQWSGKRDAAAADGLAHPDTPHILYSYFLPAFTTGNFPWTRRKYATQFDEKARGEAFYPFTRTLKTKAKSGFGYWDTRNENRNGRVVGRGDFTLAVRFWDHWGSSSCHVAKIRLDN